MCKSCLCGGTPLPNCLTKRACPTPTPSRAPPPAASVGPATGGVASVPASVCSALASKPNTGPASPPGRPETLQGRLAAPLRRPASPLECPATPSGRPTTPIAGPSGTGPRPPLARQGSSASVKSSSSNISIISTATDASVKSLNTLTNTISRDLHNLTALADELRAWVNTVDPTVYAEKKLGTYEVWPPEVQRAYDHYKAAVEQASAARTACTEFSVAHPRTSDYTLLIKHAHLAVAWGRAAYKGARGRIVFIESVGRYAFKDVPSVLRHIEEGMRGVRSSRNAVDAARKSVNRIFTAMGRDVPGDDFFR